MLFNSRRQRLCKDELECVFTTFAIQVALDNTDIGDRLEKQKNTCATQHKRLVLYNLLISTFLHSRAGFKDVEALELQRSEGSYHFLYELNHFFLKNM